MRHLERGSERSVRRVRVGHTIRWCDRDCRVLAIAWPAPRTRRQWRRLVSFTVDIPDIGVGTLSYESTERVTVVDFDDPRLAAS